MAAAANHDCAIGAQASKNARTRDSPPRAPMAATRRTSLGARPVAPRLASGASSATSSHACDGHSLLRRGPQYQRGGSAPRLLASNSRKPTASCPSAASCVVAAIGGSISVSGTNDFDDEARRLTKDLRASSERVPLRSTRSKLDPAARPHGVRRAALELFAAAALAVAVVALILALPGHATPTSKPSPSGTPGVPWVDENFHGDGLVVTLHHPIAWRSQLQPLSLHYTTVFGFLANFPLKQFCSNPTSYILECNWANAGKIPPGGVVVEFGTAGYGPGSVQKNRFLSQGTLTTIDGHRASEQYGAGCPGSGADHSLAVWIDDGKSVGVFAISFCWLGSSPSLAQDVRIVAAGLSLRPDPSKSGPFPS